MNSLTCNNIMEGNFLIGPKQLLFFGEDEEIQSYELYQKYWGISKEHFGLLNSLKLDKKSKIKKIEEKILNLKGQDKLYFLYFYIDLIISDNPAKADNILSLLNENFKNNNEIKSDFDIHLWTQTVFMLADIDSKYIVGNYTYLLDNEQYSLITIENLFTLISNEKYLLKKIINLNNLSSLIANFSQYLIDSGKIQKAQELIIKILILRQQTGINKYFLLLQSFLVQSYLKIGDLENTKKLFNELEQNYGVFIKSKKKSGLQSFTINNQDQSKLLITKLEIFIKTGGKDKEILDTIEELSILEEIDYDYKIKFEYLKGLYFYNLSKTNLTIINEIKDKISEIISPMYLSKKNNSKNNISEDMKYYLVAKKILKKIIKDFSSQENKTFLIEPLLLLSKMESNKEKSIGYFQKSWSYNKNHFKENFEKSVYFEVIYNRGVELFPQDKVEHLNLRNDNYNLNKEKNLDKGIILDKKGINMECILDEIFGIKEILIHKLGSDKIQFCHGFESLGCPGLNANCNIDKCNFLKTINPLINSDKWSEIFDNIKDPIELIKMDYFSKTLSGKIINVGPEYFLVLVGRGEKNLSNFNSVEFGKISIYLRELLSREVLENYSEEIALKTKETEKLYHKLQQEIFIKIMLLRMITHDLRGLISSLEGISYFGASDFLDFLETIDINNDTLNQNSLDMKGNILNSYDSLKMISEMLKYITENVRELLVSSSGKKEILEISLVNIGLLISQIVKVQKESATFKNKNIIIELCDFKDDIFIEADENKLKMIFTNILGNAIKYTNLKNENGQIKISYIINFEDIKIIIEDNGIGIKSGDCDKIFDFETQVGESDLNAMGTGIGLYLVDRFVKQLSGSVKAYSEGIGKGTRFEIILPLKQIKK